MSAQDWSPSAAYDTWSEDGICDAKKLVEHAKVTLLQREHHALQDKRIIEFKKERIRSLLHASMDIANKDDSPENVAELERAIKAAQKAGVLPGVRVRARKLLERILHGKGRARHVEDLLQRTTRQLEEVHKTRHDKDHDASTGIRNQVARQLREDLLIQQLKEAVDQSAGLSVDQAVIEKANIAAKKVQRDRRVTDLATKRLQGLLLVDDAQTLGDKLQSVRRLCDLKSEGVQSVVLAIQDRVEKLATREQHQQWLSAELANAAEHSDALRLRQLFDQAKMLGLDVPPSMMALLHDLEAAQQPRQRVDPLAPAPRDHPALPRSPANSQHEAVEAAVAEAERHPGAEELAAARAAVAGAQQTRSPSEVLLALQRRLAALEQQHGQRLQAEEDLRGLLHATEAQGRRREAAPSGGYGLEQRLRAALHEAERHEADPDLITAGMELLRQSTRLADARRNAEELLRQALARPAHSEADLDLLQEAVEEGRKCGTATLQAERELARARDVQVHREAAEAELHEAAKGFGLQGRVRLEAAVQMAKNVGVSAEKLRIANARLAELRKHEERCALAAGNLRRALALLQSEPWRFQQVMEGVQVLHPWTPELERLVRDGEQRLEKTLAAQSRKREAERELCFLLQQIKEGRSGGHLCGDHMMELPKSMARAKAANVGENLLREAEELLSGLRREDCQRAVAEHRLRLALRVPLSARDPAELERSVRQVRALGRAGLLEAAPGPAPARAPRPPALGSSPVMGPASAVPALGQSPVASPTAALATLAPGPAPGSPTSATACPGEGTRADAPARSSARLLEAAGAALRQMGDAAARRQAATAALQKLVDGTAGPQDPVCWLQEAAEALHEARQSGVAPALIEHARLRVREKRRERHEERQACAALRGSLSKKDAPTQELLRNICKVQRLQSAR